jgi:hypothetical protein
MFTTTADEKLDEATECVRIAANNLACIVIDKCDGHDEYVEIYKQKILKSLTMLIDIGVLLER